MIELLDILRNNKYFDTTMQSIYFLNLITIFDAEPHTPLQELCF
jgi:hypothetical protein